MRYFQVKRFKYGFEKRRLFRPTRADFLQDFPLRGRYQTNALPRRFWTSFKRMFSEIPSSRKRVGVSEKGAKKRLWSRSTDIWANQMCRVPPCTRPTVLSLQNVTKNQIFHSDYTYLRITDTPQQEHTQTLPLQLITSHWRISPFLAGSWKYKKMLVLPPEDIDMIADTYTISRSNIVNTLVSCWYYHGTTSIIPQCSMEFQLMQKNYAR